MKTTLNFIVGMVYGAAFGAAAVLLLTPLSGQDLRQQARQRYQSLLDEGQQAAAARRAELESQLAALKQPRA
ncbi:MAG: YtxH domain-containing protein [Thermoflexales bacterium]|nr:YtxH domain-containing protein [Thermoflexales bacterium]